MWYSFSFLLNFFPLPWTFGNGHCNIQFVFFANLHWLQRRKTAESVQFIVNKRVFLWKKNEDLVLWVSLVLTIKKRIEKISQTRIGKDFWIYCDHLSKIHNWIQRLTRSLFYKTKYYLEIIIKIDQEIENCHLWRWKGETIVEWWYSLRPLRLRSQKAAPPGSTAVETLPL